MRASLAAATAERDTARDDGRRAGLAEAAEIADKQWKPNPKIPYGTSDTHEWMRMVARDIANAIRAERDRLTGAGATEGS